MSKHARRGDKPSATTNPRYRRTNNSETRHSKQDALSPKEFEQLVEGCYAMSDFYRIQCTFVGFVCGRLGLRAGELAHLKDSWIDWEHKRIVVPNHEPCTDGQDGGHCSYCRKCARQMVAHDDDDELDFETALSWMWSPKTEAGAREVPFDTFPRAEIAIRRFADRFDAWPASRQSINRRVDKMCRHAEGLSESDCYPHALRATAVTNLVRRGIDPEPLQAMMGWASIGTSDNYIADSGDRLANALRQLS